MGKVRIAAVADIHCYEEVRTRLRSELAMVNGQADVLVLAGDLTMIGKLSEARILIEELQAVRVPIVAVLGNHDHEMDQEAAIARLLTEAGVHVLDGSSVTLTVKGATVGFAGAKGFCGGFGRRMITDFGERPLKEFVRVGMREARKLEEALRSLDSDFRVVVLHYSPTKETLLGESPELFAFLGSSGLGNTIDSVGADVVFHGHAHYGSPSGHTPGGIPVYNVSHSLVRGFVVHALEKPGRAGAVSAGAPGATATPLPLAAPSGTVGPGVDQAGRNGPIGPGSTPHQVEQQPPEEAHASGHRKHRPDVQ